MSPITQRFPLPNLPFEREVSHPGVGTEITILGKPFKDSQHKLIVIAIECEYATALLVNCKVGDNGELSSSAVVNGIPTSEITKNCHLPSQRPARIHICAKEYMFEIFVNDIFILDFVHRANPLDFKRVRVDGAIIVDEISISPGSIPQSMNDSLPPPPTYDIASTLPSKKPASSLPLPQPPSTSELAATISRLNIKNEPVQPVKPSVHPVQPIKAAEPPLYQNLQTAKSTSPAPLAERILGPSNSEVINVALRTVAQNVQAKLASKPEIQTTKPQINIESAYSQQGTTSTATPTSIQMPVLNMPFPSAPPMQMPQPQPVQQQAPNIAYPNASFYPQYPNAMPLSMPMPQPPPPLPPPSMMQPPPQMYQSPYMSPAPPFAGPGSSIPTSFYNTVIPGAPLLAQPYGLYDMPTAIAYPQNSIYFSGNCYGHYHDSC